MPEKNAAGWTQLPPEKSPEPTIWPAALALGTVLALWGLVSSFLVAAAGMALLAVSVAGWMRDLRHD